ncbi:MAG: GxxExxY protein [Candidatus Cloacimonetes bacterium HGW-Cloacimonetes-3]|jgi:GxxExxY protein|nr:MAG: GxxExxY protein [Candidatus Cloacimonetes bacterium HGW-Cloacimonetes-3]
MSNENFLHSDLSDKILKCYYAVYNKLGYGFLEKVYENALKYELEKCGLEVESQKPIKVMYAERIVGDYYADMVVNNAITVELKASEILNKNHQYQLQNYLRATNIEVGLLLNFGHKPEFARRVFSNERKLSESV